MTADQVLWECFRHFLHLDHSNAAIHCAPVRFSPLTFRLAELLADTPRDWLHPVNVSLLDEVLRSAGTYPEDTGR